MSLREKSRRRIRLSTNHPRSRDSSLRRESEERSSTRERRLKPSRPRRNPRPSMINFSQTSSRKERPSIPRKKELNLKSKKLRLNQARNNPTTSLPLLELKKRRLKLRPKQPPKKDKPVLLH
jgi:hypothetical protein